MPNGYDWLFSEVLYITELRKYCDWLLDSQKKMLDSRQKWGFRNPALHHSMKSLIQETDHIKRHVDKVYQNARPHIIELNETIGKRLGKPVFDLVALEAELDSTADKISKQKEQLNALKERRKDSVGHRTNAHSKH